MNTIFILRRIIYYYDMKKFIHKTRTSSVVLAGVEVEGRRLSRSHRTVFLVKYSWKLSLSDLHQAGNQSLSSLLRFGETFCLRLPEAKTLTKLFASR